MYHLIARCCESASQWKSDISVVNRNSRLETNNVLKFDLTRSKTKTIQDPVVYAHKNKLLWDLYFALGMHLAMESQPQRQLFPDFFKTLTKVKWNGKGDSHESKATNLWNRYHKEMLHLSEHYKGLFLLYLLIICLFIIQ